MGSISLNKLGPAKYKVKMVFKSQELLRAEALALKKINLKKQIKGFRKGKAPDHLLRSLFRGELARESSLNLVESSLPEIQKKLETSIHQIISIEWNDENSLNITFDCLPLVKFCKFREVVLYDDEIDVSDEMIDSVIQQYQLEIAQKTKIEKKIIKYQKGDLIIVDIEVLLDEIPIGAPQNGVSLILGQNKALEALEKHILDCQPALNAEFQINDVLDGPDNKGKKLTQIVSIQSVYELEYPAIDNNFPKLIDESFQDLKTLKEDIKNKIAKADEQAIQSEQSFYALKIYMQKSEIIISQIFFDHHFELYMKKIQVDKDNIGEDDLVKYRKDFEEALRYQIIREKLIQIAYENKDIEKMLKPDQLSEEDKVRIILDLLRKKDIFKKGLKQTRQQIMQKRFNLSPS